MSKENQMDRREFLRLFGIALGSTALGNLVGCSNSPRTITVNNKTYQIQGGVISQATKGNNNLKLGILADQHAHTKNTEQFVKELDKEVETYFLAGDLSHSFGDYEGTKDDKKEILSVVEPVAETGKLVLVIPGNHEQRKTYTEALEELTSKYQNVIDMEKVPVADLDDLTIVALGGNANQRFCVPNGFLRNRKDLENLRELVKKHQGNKPLLVGTHAPRTYKTRKGLDVIDSGRNVGLLNYIEANRVSGHIHEASGIITPDEEPVKPGELTDLIEFNPGPVYDHLKRKHIRNSAGLVEFKGDKVRAYIL